MSPRSPSRTIVGLCLELVEDAVGDDGDVEVVLVVGVLLLAVGEVDLVLVDVRTLGSMCGSSRTAPLPKSITAVSPIAPLTSSWRLMGRPPRLQLCPWLTV